MVALIRSSTLVGIDAVPIDVECVITPGQLPAFNIVGLPAPSVKEGAVRVRSALLAVGQEVPQKKVTVNLAPADLRKPGSALDLPTALSILLADGSFSAEQLDGVLVLGELGLDGAIRAVPGVLASTMMARERRMRGILVPATCAAEALVVEGIAVFAARHLSEVTEALIADRELPVPLNAPARRRRFFGTDMADVRGQEFARSAIEVAVAGGHNLLLSGPPGTGKTMLARRIPSVLPPMTHEEALETTKIYSALGLADGLMTERPFRAPHHTISGAALLGGGSTPRPGEISLAHNGVLFLDELPEFARHTIEALRQPLEERSVTISRVHGTIKLPSSFLLVAASNPCPCGWLESGVRECVCSRFAVERYRSRMSGPLLDRIDLQVYVKPVELKILRDPCPAEPSARIRARVLEARARQAARLGKWNLRCNAEMPAKVLRETCALDEHCELYLKHLVEERKSMSARSIDRLLKVARTVADLLGQDAIDKECLREAATYRAVDPTADVFAAVPQKAAGPSLLARLRSRDGATVIVEADELEDDMEVLATLASPAQVAPQRTRDEHAYRQPTPDDLAAASAELPPLPPPP